jgi:hypothetical protein
MTGGVAVDTHNLGDFLDGDRDVIEGTWSRDESDADVIGGDMIGWNVIKGT